jgi:DNA repair protein RadC
MVFKLAILAQDVLTEDVFPPTAFAELEYVINSSRTAGLAEPRLDLAALPARLDIGRMGSVLGQVQSSLHDGSSETETLQMLLELVLDEAPSARLAARLIDCFGSLGSVVSASAEALHVIAGVAAPIIALLKLVHHATFRITHAEVKARPVIGNWDKLIDYLTVSMAYEAVEQMRVLFLDNQNTLIADEVMGRGTVNFVNVYPREILKRALALDATAIILVHNHPSGCSNPSRDDVTMTKAVQAALDPIDITLHDHVIIGKGNYYSFRQRNLLSGSCRR